MLPGDSVSLKGASPRQKWKFNRQGGRSAAILCYVATVVAHVALPPPVFRMLMVHFMIDIEKFAKQGEKPVGVYPNSDRFFAVTGN